MKSLFNQLSGNTRFTQVLYCVDAAISFHSDQQELIDLFIGPLGYILPSCNVEPQIVVSCVVASTTIMQNWPEEIKEKAISITTINDMTIGEATLIATECGRTLVIDGLGSLYYSGDGHFLCLVKPSNRNLKPGEYLNVLGLSTVLVSETLLLTEKLLVHAGAVGTHGMCQIWTGDSGSGKTTRVLVKVSQGWDFYGEDQIIIGRAKDKNWYVWPFWRQIKVSAETSRLFPTTQDLSIRPPNSRKKYSFDNIEEVLQVKKPAPALLSSIIKLIPGDQGVMEQLDFTAAFSHLSGGFLHSLLPNSTSRVMDIFLNIIDEIPIFLVSWDMLDEFENFQSGPAIHNYANGQQS
jgi:hypothetical protein